MGNNIGKGDLVGCDISLNLIHNGQQGVSGTGGQDFILKSSSDVKVSRLSSKRFFFSIFHHIFSRH